MKKPSQSNLLLLFLALELVIKTTVLQAVDIAAGPLVQQQINRDNWEPGGKYFPKNFTDRGRIVEQGGAVLAVRTSVQNLGGWSHQTASISGQLTYTIDLDSNHLWTVHSPFDRADSASDSVSTSGPGREVTVNMVWNGTMVHPANGYDGAQGGSYPQPKGARDLFSFDISGTATGLYRLSTQEVQRTTGSTQRNTTLSPYLSLQIVASMARLDPRSNVSANSISIQQTANPRGYQQSNLERHGGLGSRVQIVIGVVQTGIGTYQDMGISDAIKRAGATGETLSVLNSAFSTINFVQIFADITVSAVEGEMAEAFNKAVRAAVVNATTQQGMLLGAKAGALGGAAVGAHFAIIGAVPGAIVGGLIGGVGVGWGASVLAEDAYDEYASSHILALGDQMFESMITGGITRILPLSAYNPFSNAVHFH